MNVVFKIDLESTLNGPQPVVLELGCGTSKQLGRIGIDRLDLPGVDIIADLEEGLPFLPANSIDEIYSKSFFEHIHNFEFLMVEINRVLKKGGKCSLFVPHFSNPYYYSDYTHVHPFGLYTFDYFVNPQYQPFRKVPSFYTSTRIRILRKTLVFTSPFLPIKAIKMAIGVLINLHSLIQELYEENLCYIFPCYGLEVVFTPDSD